MKRNEEILARFCRRLVALDMFINRLVHEGFMTEDEALKHGWKKPAGKRRPLR